jgi:hypothetical protein
MGEQNYIKKLPSSCFFPFNPYFYIINNVQIGTLKQTIDDDEEAPLRLSRGLPAARGRLRFTSHAKGAAAACDGSAVSNVYKSC